jgi:hypothetical protein
MEKVKKKFINSASNVLVQHPGNFKCHTENCRVNVAFFRFVTSFCPVCGETCYPVFVVKSAMKIVRALSIHGMK